MGEARQRRLPAAACAGERAGRRGEGRGGQGRGGEAAEPVVAASMEQLSEVLLQREGGSEGQINISLSLPLQLRFITNIYWYIGCL